MEPQGQAAPAPTTEAPAQEGAPQEGGEDPIMQLAQMAQQALEGQDCNAAMAACEALLSMLQQGGGEQSQAPQGAPVYKKGGVLVKRI